MRNCSEKGRAAYSEDAMTRAVCLVCGERLGRYGYIYLGRPVCRGCLDYIRESF